jgi:transcriptional antiterminator RfaH
MPPFWCAARLMPKREAVATQCLTLAGFETYLPRLRECRVVRGRRVEITPVLFPGYLFILVGLRWWDARWAWGISALIMDGTRPARVPDDVIAAIRARERGGLIELPKLPRLKRGDRVRIVAGPFAEHLAMFDGMRPGDRVAVLLKLLGGQHRAEMPASAVEPVEVVP